MAKLPENVPDNGWDSPEPAELADRMNARLGQTDEGDTPEPEPAPDDTPAKGTDDEQEPTAKAKDGEADRTGGKADPDEDDRVFEIDGEKFTADEIREMKLGALRQADYTRKTQQLAEQRRSGDEALTQMVEQNRQMMQYLLRQAGAAIDPNTGLPVNTEDPGEPLDPRVARTLEEQNQRLNTLLEARQAEHEAAQQGALDDFIIANFDRSLTTLFDKFGVKDQRERALYRNAIVGADPQTVDPATGEFLGVAGLNRIHKAEKFGNLHYWVRSGKTRRGIATQAAKLVCLFGIKELGLQRIGILVPEGNFASEHVAQKLGATREGILRNGTRLHDCQMNATQYSLIPSDLDRSLAA